MMQRFLQSATRFSRREDGSVAVEFAIVAPVFLFFMMAATEMGLMTIRNTLLERGLDETVRWVRLNTGVSPSHDDLKEMICEFGAIPDCMANLQLEMIIRDLRDWTDLPTEYTCTDRSLEVQPMAELSLGSDNELMVLRACAKYEPIFPSSLFSQQLETDAAGDVNLTAMSAFVQEPM